MKEIWKDVEGYEGIYQISNTGKVKSLERTCLIRNNSTRIVKECILKPKITRLGYKEVTLYKDKTKKNLRINRLVAIAFIPNPHNYPIVNHKDEDKLNNNESNLEWCTHKYNSNYGTSIDRLKNSEGFKKHINSLKKKIIQYDLNMNFVKEWSDSYAVAKELNVKRECIRDCCNHKQKTDYGYIWEYDRRI